jgi:7,8-dihydropterin-6-yl-methyl-4-(beta-D-ribofuranosyl)aminobenzene 5'-phosphate synthase
MVNKKIGSVKGASLTILVDNKANLMVKSSEVVKVFTDEPLLAEHGFSVLIKLDDSEETILWDAGVSKVALIENVRRMKINPTLIKKIALSHGHFDHYAALTELLNEMALKPQPKEWGKKVASEDVEAWIEEHKIPIVAHPAAFRERWWEKDDGTMAGPISPPPQDEWEAAGAKVILSEEPFELAPGCWTTGYIPRRSFEEVGRPKGLRFREGSNFILDDIEDDQAIVINVKGKGLVVLSGCAHAGIVNTIQHAQDFTGIEQIYAVIGGFHLARAKDDELEQTIDFIKSVQPKYVVPSHCTGFHAINQFAVQMPESFVESVVGATFIL